MFVAARSNIGERRSVQGAATLIDEVRGKRAGQIAATRCCSLLLVAAHELVEATHEALAVFILIQKGELLLFELFEELVPRDVFELAVVAIVGEVDTQYADVVLALGGLDRGRAAAAFLDSVADLVMIGGGGRGRGGRRGRAGGRRGGGGGAGRGD